MKMTAAGKFFTEKRIYFRDNMDGHRCPKCKRKVDIEILGTDKHCGVKLKPIMSHRTERTYL